MHVDEKVRFGCGRPRVGGRSRVLVGGHRLRAGRCVPRVLLAGTLRAGLCAYLAPFLDALISKWVETYGKL